MYVILYYPGVCYSVLSWCVKRNTAQCSICVYLYFIVFVKLFHNLQLCMLPFCPESPNWLYFNKEREDLAKQGMKY